MRWRLQRIPTAEGAHGPVSYPLELERSDGHLPFQLKAVVPKPFLEFCGEVRFGVDLGWSPFSVQAKRGQSGGTVNRDSWE